MRNIGEFEVVNHGIENFQFFQGCGTAFTRFGNCATGIGDNPAEAVDDCDYDDCEDEDYEDIYYDYEFEDGEGDWEEDED